jgi:hypothetical protein
MLDSENMNIKNENYICELCNYTCKKKSSLEKHNATKKHISLIISHNEELNGGLCEKHYLCQCGKGYKHRQSLHSHKKKCVIVNAKQEWCAPQVDEIEEPQQNFQNFKELIVDLMKKNQDLQETVVKQQEDYKKDIVNLIPMMGNNNHITNNINNKINLNVFLNENCKEALNIEDFMNSLQISFADLEMTREKGLLESVNNQIIQSLRNMEIEKRPFHCSDQKRRIMHIKDNNEWQRDNNCEKIKSSIDHLAKKQLSNFNVWEKENPDYMNSSVGQEEYMQLVSNITKEVSDDDKGNNKIIGSIAKEVSI